MLNRLLYFASSTYLNCNEEGRCQSPRCVETVGNRTGKKNLGHFGHVKIALSPQTQRSRYRLAYNNTPALISNFLSFCHQHHRPPYRSYRSHPPSSTNGVTLLDASDRDPPCPASFMVVLWTTTVGLSPGRRGDHVQRIVESTVGSEVQERSGRLMTTKLSIRPALFAFFTHPMPKHRAYIKENFRIRL